MADFIFCTRHVSREDRSAEFFPLFHRPRLNLLVVHAQPNTGLEERLLRRIAREVERLYADGEYEDAAARIYAMTESYRKV